jgi:hypothetical protein
MTYYNFSSLSTDYADYTDFDYASASPAPITKAEPAFPFCEISEICGLFCCPSADCIDYRTIQLLKSGALHYQWASSKVDTQVFLSAQSEKSADYSFV